MIYSNLSILYVFHEDPLKFFLLSGRNFLLWFIVANLNYLLLLFFS